MATRCRTLAVCWLAGVLACSGTGHDSGHGPDAAADTATRAAADTLAEVAAAASADAAPDADSLAPPGGPCSTLDALDPTQPQQLLGILGALFHLRHMGRRHDLGLSEAVTGCPAADRAGGHAWMGGCDTPTGTSFGGLLRRVDAGSGDGLSRTWHGDKWQVVASAGPDPIRVGLHGQWRDQKWTAGGIGHVRATGTGWFVFEGGTDGAVPYVAMPHGATGVYEFSGSWGPQGDRHRVLADLVVSCRGPLAAEIDLIESTGICEAGTPSSGLARIGVGSTWVEVDFGPAGQCAPCRPWRVDGVLQADPLCGF